MGVDGDGAAQPKGAGQHGAAPQELPGKRLVDDVACGRGTFTTELAAQNVFTVAHVTLNHVNLAMLQKKISGKTYPGGWCGPTKVAWEQYSH